MLGIIVMLVGLALAFGPTGPRASVLVYGRCYYERLRLRSWNAWHITTPAKFGDMVQAWIGLAITLWGVSLLGAFGSIDGWGIVFLVVGCVVIVLYCLPMLARRNAKAAQGRHTLTPAEHRAYIADAKKEFHVGLGATTAYLHSARWDKKHGFPAANTPIYIGAHQACQGILVEGAPGSAKTRGAWLKALEDALRDLTTGAVVFVVKKTMTKQVRAVARRAGRSPDDVIVVGPGKRSMNLFGTMTPNAIGAGFRDAIGNDSSEFWRTAPSNLVKNYCSLLKGIGPVILALPPLKIKDPVTGVEQERPRSLKCSYAPDGLYEALFAGSDGLQSMLMHAASVYDQLSAIPNPDRAARQRLDSIKSSLRYFDGPYKLTFEATSGSSGNETTAGIYHTIEPYLNALIGTAEICEAFGSKDDVTLDVLNDGKILIVEINEKDYPDAARLVHNITFQQIGMFASERLDKHNNLVVVGCDEYVSMASAQHGKAWREIRESKCAGLIAIQSRSSLEQAVGAAAMRDIMNSFSNFVCFSLSDPTSREFYTKHLGTAKVPYMTRNAMSIFSGGFHPHSIATQFVVQRFGSAGTQYGEHDETIMDGDAWASLGVYSTSEDGAAQVETYADDDDIHGSGIEATALVVTKVNGIEMRDICTFPVLTDEVLGIVDGDAVEAA